MTKSAAKPPSVFEPFRRAIFRGLAVILPPLLTIVVFIWAGGLINTYILVPCQDVVGSVIVWSIRDVKPGIPDGATIIRSGPGGPVTSFEFKGREYVQAVRGGKWIPKAVHDMVESNLKREELPATADAYYDRYVHMRYLRPAQTVPVFLGLFVIILYLTGKLMAAGVGRYARRVGEGVVDRMPIVRDVYSAAKQITETVFSEREQEMQFLRVVAVEYPRKGLWQIAFVTGEGFRDLQEAAGEPIVSLLISHSPIPATGFTCTALKRDTIELNVTVDQAMQYIVSCGVVVPPHQRWSTGSNRAIGDDMTRHIEQTTDKAQRLIESA